MEWSDEEIIAFIRQYLADTQGGQSVGLPTLPGQTRGANGLLLPPNVFGGDWITWSDGNYIPDGEVVVYEDGSTSGESPSSGTMSTGEFDPMQQPPASTEPLPTQRLVDYLTALQAGLEQSQADPNRFGGGPRIGYSGDPYFGEYTAALANYSREGRSPVPPVMQGLFGGTGYGNSRERTIAPPVFQYDPAKVTSMVQRDAPPPQFQYDPERVLAMQPQATTVWRPIVPEAQARNTRWVPEHTAEPVRTYTYQPSPALRAVLSAGTPRSAATARNRR